MADGVGSIENSELASRYILYCLEECNPRKAEEITQCINQANIGLVKNNYGSILSTTLCAVGILGSQLISYNVGNSRLYRFRGSYLRQLTRDHSKVQELLDMGRLNEETAKDYPEKNVITKCLGAAGFSTDWITVTEHRENFIYNDVLMLCTDGIHDYIEIEELESILSEDMSLRDKARKIIQSPQNIGFSLKYVLNRQQDHLKYQCMNAQFPLKLGLIQRVVLGEHDVSLKIQHQN